MKRLICLITVTLISAITTNLGAQNKGGPDVTGEYDRVSDWLKPVETGRIIYPVTVFAESGDRVFIGINGTTPALKPGEHRLDGGMNPKMPGAKVDHQVFVVNQNGEKIEEWSQWADHFGSLQKITENPYDPDKHVWIIDRTSQQVMEFTNDGKKLVFTVGEKGVAGNDEKHFGGPADICWLPDGTFFVADGFVNSRVVKFDKDGKYLLSWGMKGTGPGQFNLVDAVAVDARRRVYVTDRKNRRIQVFDENGKYLDEWTGFEEPMKVLITQDQHAWVLDGATARFAKYDLNGKLLTSWSTDAPPDRVSGGGSSSLAHAGGLAGPDDFSVDPDNNLYVSDGRSWTIDKFVPKKDADESRLLGQPYFLELTRDTY